jgi:hypothetical protein
VFNTTFKNISVTTFVAEIGIPREIHRPVASHWQTLSHIVLSSTPRHEWGSNSQIQLPYDHDGSRSVKMKGNCFIDIDGIYDYHCL